MTPAPPPGSLRNDAPLRVLEGFGRAVAAVSRYAAPATVAELAAVLAQARREGLPVTLRGAGRSYGDASLGTGGLAIDTTALNRVLAWDPAAGVVDVEPGVTIEDLWTRTIADGYWPPVVPGTMRPTLGGCAAMNVHGKNNFRAGPIGDHVLDLELLLADGRTLRASRDENADVFHAAIGGLGLLGAVTRLRLELKPVTSGRLRVLPLSAPTLDAMFDAFAAHLPDADYLVGWLDCLAEGDALGRGVVHAARHLRDGEDPDGRAWLDPARQGLPPKILGFPRDKLWLVMRAFMNDPGVALMNAAKYHSARLQHGRTYLQSHVAFAFLLDYVPHWRLAYGPGGFIQYQLFVPDPEARACFRDVLRLGQRAGLPSYLGVLKRHRPDAFLLSHAVDGWSLALDFRADPADRARLRSLVRAMTERVLAAGGRFYFAKDGVLAPADVERAYGADRLRAFAALKARLDPGGLFMTDLARRALPPWVLGRG